MSGLNPDTAVSKFTEVLPESPGGRRTETLSRGLNVAVPGIRVQAEARQPQALLADTPGPPSREKAALCIFLVKLFLKEVAGLRSRQPHQAAGHHEPRRVRRDGVEDVDALEDGDPAVGKLQTRP